MYICMNECMDVYIYGPFLKLKVLGLGPPNQNLYRKALLS